jgi:hypothetical protein
MAGLAVVAALALPLSAFAAAKSGNISGQVSNSKGVPQMGVVVELRAPGAAEGIRVFTDSEGRYAAKDVPPGLYQIKASAVSFLPSLREDVAIRAGANLIINLTLNTLSEALQLLPPRRGPQDDEEDWKWTLRSTASRPVLRVLEEDGPLVVVSRSDSAHDRVLKARVAFVAGSDADGFGGAADVTTRFRLERSLFSSGTLALDGRVGYGSGSPNSVVRASYQHELPNGQTPRVALTVRNLASPDVTTRKAALQALALTLSNEIVFADLVEVGYGAELQSIEFMGRATAFRPFGSVALHLTPDTVVRYKYETFQPNTRLEKGFDTAPADLSESGPRMALRNGTPTIERARHQEVSVSQRLGDTSVQVAYFSDRVSDAALAGVGAVSLERGEALPDVYSGTFSYYGGALGTSGMRVVVERRIGEDWKTTLDYAYGGVITVGGDNLQWDNVQGSLYNARRHALAAKVAGRVPGASTRWTASYRWTSGTALSPVDAFDSSPGQSDPYLSFFVRQPVPSLSFLPGHMEALVDVRNLLAQGYVPVLTSDGQALYLVQAARSIRGGLAFNF